MPGSPLLSSSVVPACGFYFQLQSRSRGVEKSSSQEAEESRSAGSKGDPHSGLQSGRRGTILLNLLTAKSREQSQNVYENKGQVQKVAESSSARPKPAACFGPQAGRRRLTPRLLDSFTCRSQNWGNKARMSMKTNDNTKSRGSGSAKSVVLGLCHHGPSARESL